MISHFLAGFVVGVVIGLAIVCAVLWVPLWWSEWRTRRQRLKVSKAILEQLQHAYGTGEFAQQWRQKDLIPEKPGSKETQKPDPA